MNTQTKTYAVKGMHCENCIKKVTTFLSSVPGVESVNVMLSASAAEITADRVIPFAELEAVFVGSDFTISAKPPSLWMRMKAKYAKFAPLAVLFAIAIIITIIADVLQHHPGFHVAMDDFMGGFFLAFGTLKVFGWKNFPAAFQRYDYIAAKSKLYAQVYPAIEIFLAVLFLSGAWLAAAGIITLIVMISNLIGVRRVLLKGSMVQCACLGGFFNIPITMVTFAEDLLMVLMAIHTLIFTARW